MKFEKSKLSQAIYTALVGSSLAGGQALAQGPVEEVVVQGIRASLERAMDIKRDSAGVVDAISAEDIGKFPDTNLAESLQRITGVAIDRVNGEGAEITVRGFGGGNNLVLLNGRHLPSANVSVIGGDQNAAFATGASRSFDFSNLASEGVAGLEVYKTGRATVAGGGLGGTVNIKTHRPLEQEEGFSGAVLAKIVHDKSVIEGDENTPEISAMLSFNGSDVWGVSLFVSHQERDSSAMSATVNGWNIRTVEQFLDTGNNFVSPTTTIANVPASSQQFVSVPNDSRWHRSDFTRERDNAMLTVQFRPTDTLTLTLDALTATNTQQEQRSDKTNWFNRPFDAVQFDDNPVVATTVFLYEDIAGVKDEGFEQQMYNIEDTLDEVGFNAQWTLSDGVDLTFDVYSAEAESSPDGMSLTLPDGRTITNNAVTVSIGAPVIAEHSLDFRRSGFPQQFISIDDTVRDTAGLDGGTNANGELDAGDLGSQMARTISSSQLTEITGGSVTLNWDVGDGWRVDAGVDARSLEMTQKRIQTQQVLGDWGINNPGDVDTSLIETFCIACQFKEFDPGLPEGDPGRIGFRANANELFQQLSALYDSRGNSLFVTNDENNTVEEDISAVFIQVTHDGELGSLPYQVVLGVRHEQTDVTSTSLIPVPQNIIWQSDNDFTITLTSERLPVTIENDYSNTLPNLDLKVELSDALVGRFSYSKTIGRPGYGSLFANINAGTPPRPTANGGVPTGSGGNPALEAMESENLDISFEYYYGEASYFSVGAYRKKVDNFIGSGVINQPLFDLRDPSSGAPGTRSGQAMQWLLDNGFQPTEVNLFTLTAMIDNPADFPDPFTEFQNQIDPVTGELDQTFVDNVLAAYDIVPDSSDPLFEFAFQTQLNNKTGTIQGLEWAWQHFFGDSGFGIQANYTTVNGDVGIDVGAPPSEDQFALLGLSDTANLTLIYERGGFSARASYNWRDSYLRSVNRGGDRNPVFVDDYRQIDVSLAWQVTDFLALTLEGINVNGENTKHYGRDESNLWLWQEFQPRYLFGARVEF